jgi:enoyl-[acyl-carrier protein] reductase III
MLARTGCRVYAIYARNRQAAESLTSESMCNGLDIRCIRADLTDTEAFSSCLNTITSETAHIDIIVHSAASGVHRPAPELTRKQLAWTFEINVFTIQKMLVELLPLMPSGGRLIGITSGGATHTMPSYGAVGASKGALDALFRHHALDLAPRGVSVNLVCPGMVVTDAIDAFPAKEERVKEALRRTPSGRLTTPEDVAAIVHFLCSDAAAQVVGQTLIVDGGCALT